MKKLLLSLAVLVSPNLAFGAVHVMVGDAVTASSVTVTGSGGVRLKEGAVPSGQTSHTVIFGDSSVNWPGFNPNNTTNYFVMGSSITPVAGDCAKFSGTGRSLLSAGAPCGSGSGASGTTNAATQTYIPFYSVSGSSNVLSGSPGISVTTITATGIVTVSSHVVVTSSNSVPALTVTANGGDYGTTAGSSGGFLASCPGTSGQGMCAQVYSNAGTQSNLSGVFNVISDNTDWNTVTMYVKADGSDPENGIRIDGNDYATLVLNDTKLSGGGSQNGKYQFSSHNNQLRGERRNAANNAFESGWTVAASTIASGGVMMITTGYENPASTLAVNGNLIVGNGYAGNTTGGAAPVNGMLVQGPSVFKSSVSFDGTGGLRIKEGAVPSGQAGHTVLYGGSGTNWPEFIPNNGASYFVMGGSMTVTAGHCAQFSGNSGSLIGSGAPCGTGAGGGTTNVSTQNYVPFYSVSGSSNVLSGSPGISVTTITATGLVTLSTFTASSATITNLIVNGSGAGELDLVEGAAPSGVTGTDILWGDSTSHSLKFNNNNGVAYQVVGSSTAPTIGQAAIWSSSNTLIGGAAGGDPTSLFTAAYGIVATSVTISSNTVMPGATFYAGGPIKLGGHVGSSGSLYINGGIATASGNLNIIIGQAGTTGSGDNLTTGNALTCIGSGSCGAVTVANAGVAYGYNALSVSTSSVNTVAIGPSSLAALTRGDQNTAVGAGALLTSVSGGNNTAIGYKACENNGTVSSTTVSNSVCIGYQSYVDANNTMAIGGITVPITDVYMNSRSQTGNTAGTSIAFHAQSSSGTDKAGGNFVIAAGQSSGAGASGDIAFKISTTSASGTLSNGAVVVSSYTTKGLSIVNGHHFNVSGSSPVLTSCGTGPSAIGTDGAFTITAGSAAGGCVATFARAYTAVPTCTVSQQSMSLVNALTYSVSATAITMTQTAMTGNIDVVCVGHD